MAVPLPCGRTLKPMTMALPPAASMMSFSVMPPTPLRMMLTLTLSVVSANSDFLSASSEPCTSAFKTKRSSSTSPLFIIFWNSSSPRAPDIWAWMGLPPAFLYESATS
jgi:hypothetical protein